MKFDETEEENTAEKRKTTKDHLLNELTDAFKTSPDSGSRGEMCRSKSQKSKFSYEVLDAKFVGTCKVHKREYLY